MALADIPYVATAFLNQYIQYCLATNTWPSAIEVRFTPSLLRSVRVAPAVAKIKMCGRINDKLNQNGSLPETLQSVAGWIDQLNKLPFEETEKKHLFWTLHAIRTYCIDQILKSEYKDEFEALRNKYKEDAMAQSMVVDEAKDKHPNIVPENLIDEYNRLMFVACNAGEKACIKIASKEALLLANYPKPDRDTSPLPQDIKDGFEANYPILYNSKYFLYHYLEFDLTLRSHLNFEEFEAAAIQNKESKIICPKHLEQYVNASPQEETSGYNRLKLFTSGDDRTMKDKKRPEAAGPPPPSPTV